MDLGHAIGIVAAPSDEETLISLATDRAHGMAREGIVSELSRVVKDKKKLKRILAQVANDSVV
jgi:hypothetical protein